ncbi:MAG: hypothetical protein WBL87_01615, partial [Methanothrix sp.]
EKPGAVLPSGPDENESEKKTIVEEPVVEPLYGPDGDESEKKTIVEEPVVEPTFVEPEPVTPIDELEPEIWHQDDLDETSEPGDNFGWSVAAGDFNNDGWDDLAIGVPKENIIETENAGVVNVLYGSSGGLEKNHWPIWYQDLGIGGKSEKDDEFGESLAAGDFDQDGFDDLAIKVPGEVIGDGPGMGALNFLFGSYGGLTNEAHPSEYQNPSTAVWIETVASGDFNGDGKEDQAIGKPESNNGAGEVEVHYGM